MGLIAESGKFPGWGNGNPLQYSCLGNPMDRGAWLGYSSWGPKESNTTGHTCWVLSTEISWIGGLFKTPGNREGRVVNRRLNRGEGEGWKVRRWMRQAQKRPQNGSCPGIDGAAWKHGGLAVLETVGKAEEVTEWPQQHSPVWSKLKSKLDLA